MLVLGLGTGRCGTKSMAHFLDNQEGVRFTHEDTGLNYNPSWGTFRDSYTKLLGYDAPIMGDFNPAWVNYVDRVVEEYQGDVRVLWLRRSDLDEVARSYYAFHSLILEYTDRDTVNSVDHHEYLMVQETYLSLRAIRRAVGRLWWQCETLAQKFSRHMFAYDFEYLNDEKVQGRLLTWLGIPEDKWVLGMKHKNTRAEKVRSSHGKLKEKYK